MYDVIPPSFSYLPRGPWPPAGESQHGFSIILISPIYILSSILSTLSSSLHLHPQRWDVQCPNTSLALIKAWGNRYDKHKNFYGFFALLILHITFILTKILPLIIIWMVPPDWESSSTSAGDDQIRHRVGVGADGDTGGAVWWQE